ncbi:hypothetical protein RIF29_10949 [Crotalaria pallida]|uniref:Uncharacterized protein n=1 Tax=Crotalaria pallida TaxID=3830 RepID=A0AAN9FWA4_CROPI
MVVSPVVEVSNQHPVVVVDSPGGAVTVTESSSVKVADAFNDKERILGSNDDSPKNEELFGAWMLVKKPLKKRQHKANLQDVNASNKHVGKEGNLAAHAMGSRFDLLKEESTPLNSNIKPKSRGSSDMGPSHVNSSSHVGVSKRVTKDFKIGPKAQTATKPHKLLAAGQQQRGSQNHKVVQAVDATPG